MTTPTRAANYLERKGWANLARSVRERESTPKQAAELIIDQNSLILAKDEMKVFKRWAGVK